MKYRFNQSYILIFKKFDLTWEAKIQGWYPHPQSFQVDKISWVTKGKLFINSKAIFHFIIFFCGSNNTSSSSVEICMTIYYRHMTGAWGSR